MTDPLTPEQAAQLIEQYYQTPLRNEERIPGEVAALIRRCQPQWISVEQQVPAENEEVLVFSPDEIGGGIWVDRRERHPFTTKVQWDTADSNGLTVTHWQPLPAPPAGKEQK